MSSPSGQPPRRITFRFMLGVFATLVVVAMLAVVGVVGSLHMQHRREQALVEKLNATAIYEPRRDGALGLVQGLGEECWGMMRSPRSSSLTGR